MNKETANGGIGKAADTASGSRYLPPDVGYLLVASGLIGFVVPGVFGLDLLALGTFMLWPGNQRRIESWLAGHPSTPRIFRGSIKQVNRFLDSLERRYPCAGADRPSPATQDFPHGAVSRWGKGALNRNPRNSREFWES